jgi:hypothetical protein
MRLAAAVVSCAAAASVFVPCLAGEGDDARAKKAVASGVQWALRWLKNHQAPDGRWDAKLYDAQCKLNRCLGAGSSAQTVRSTGLALLAFLGAGETPTHGSHRDSVKNGLAWLRGTQDAQGGFGPKDAARVLAEHAVAAVAMTEAAGMTGDAECIASAQKAVTFLFDSPAANGPWRRDFPKDGAVDVQALPWVVFALKSAEMSKLKVDADALTRVIAWLDARTDATTGAVAERPGGAASDFLTATGFLTRVFAGHRPATDPKLVPAGVAISKRPPAWDAANAAIDPVAWHLGTLTLFQMGGEGWAAWKAAATETLVRNQRMEPDRDERGSWEPLGAAVKGGGRIETTAVFTMMLLVCAR